MKLSYLFLGLLFCYSCVEPVKKADGSSTVYSADQSNKSAVQIALYQDQAFVFEERELLEQLGLTNVESSNGLTSDMLAPGTFTTVRKISGDMQEVLALLKNLQSRALTLEDSVGIVEQLMVDRPEMFKK